MDDRTADQVEPPQGDLEIHAHAYKVRWAGVRPPLVTTDAPLKVDTQRRVEEFSAFYRGFATRLAGWLIWQGASEADAYDIMQETMQTVFRRWESIEYPKAFARETASRAYVARLARVDPVPVEDIADRMPHSHSGSALADVKHDIRKALEKMPPRQVQLLAWSFEEHTPTEIAAQLQMTPEAVRSSLYKARKKLGELLQAQDADDQ
ncbi:RNA polymerase sigma-70 factor, ECF subfamily [Micromonospora nigra]|uniref:RNA polymerase sigma-70 factor, ECF subfamily n=1 Tax=Micromonospora nigra TaxID=145857 RepID=A0A1C6S8T9_9ACTN|nr:sigma-70 family RNA polymerase sigma factor [Micromonospora nigra]SCL25803.1 RNA polymerase sigma-70 factor, ECF subfamily [Micromonospora nigra]